MPEREIARSPSAKIGRVYFAHAGHWLTSIAYFVPVIAFMVWLLITQIRERRGRSRG